MGLWFGRTQRSPRWAPSPASDDRGLVLEDERRGVYDIRYLNQLQTTIYTSSAYWRSGNILNQDPLPRLEHLPDIVEITIRPLVFRHLARTILKDEPADTFGVIRTAEALDDDCLDILRFIFLRH
jgi:hypothetical protein